MPPRRITPIPVNKRSANSLALRQMLNEQRALLKKAKDAKRMREILKRMIRNSYVSTLIGSRPNVTNYQRRSSYVRRKSNSTGPNINFLLFRNKKK